MPDRQCPKCGGPRKSGSTICWSCQDETPLADCPEASNCGPALGTSCQAGPADSGSPAPSSSTPVQIYSGPAIPERWSEGLQGELAKLYEMARLTGDEVVTFAMNAGVSGIGSSFGREGIVFLTRARCGVSSAGSLFTTDAWVAFEFRDVRGVRYEQNGEVTTLLIEHVDGREIRAVRLGTNNLSPREAAEVATRFQRFREIVEYQCNQSVRSDCTRNFELLEESLAAADYQAARGWAEAILAAQPSCIAALARLGISAAELGDLAAAFRAYQRAIDLGIEQVAEVRTRMAELKLKAEEYEAAVEEATLAIDLGGVARALSIRAQARMMLGDHEGRAVDLRRLLQLSPDDAGAWSSSGKWAFIARDIAALEEAIRNLRRLGSELVAKALEPGLLWHQGKMQEALQAAEAVLAEGASWAPVAYPLLLAAREVNPEVGLKYISQLDASYAEDVPYQQYAALVLVAAQRAGEAWDRIRAARPILEGCIPNAYFDYYYGLALAEAGAYEELRALLAGHLGPVAPAWIEDELDQRVWLTMNFLGGWAELELGRPREALEMLLRAEAMPKPPFPWVGAKLAELIDRAGRLAPGAPSGTYAGPGAYQLLSRLAESLEASGRLHVLALRVRSERAQFDEPPLVAVMGEYSVGKSSFINAMLGKALLPTGDAVTTGTITILRFGEQERMRAVFRDGRVEERESLGSVAQFVQETGGAGKASDLPSHVDVFLRAEILKRIRIVDSPGLNAPFPEHAKTTERFLAQADAILWLFNADAAGKAGEQVFLAKLGEHRRKVIAVVNMIDLVPRAEVPDVLEGIEADFPGTFATVFGVSAKRALEAQSAEDAKGYERSGMPALVAWMESNLLASSRRVKEEAVREKIREVVADVRAAREEFDRTVEQSAGAIKQAKHDVKIWAQGPLRQVVAEQYASMRRELEAALDDAAVQMAARSGAAEPATFATVEPIANRLRLRCEAAWAQFSRGVVAEYRKGCDQLRASVSNCEQPEWQGVLVAGLREVALSVASWEKDLLDYVEQATAFLAGHTEARGLATIQRVDLPRSAASNPQALGAVLRAKMPFLWERIDSASTRWLRELTLNVEERLTKIDREIRTEASRVREVGYRQVERAVGGGEPVGAAAVAE